MGILRTCDRFVFNAQISVRTRVYHPPGIFHVTGTAFTPARDSDRQSNRHSRRSRSVQYTSPCEVNVLVVSAVFLAIRPPCTCRLSGCFEFLKKPGIGKSFSRHTHASPELGVSCAVPPTSVRADASKLYRGSIFPSFSRMRRNASCANSSRSAVRS